jgi:hypothetical protein
MAFEILHILSTDFLNGKPLYDVSELTSAAQLTLSQLYLSLICLTAHTLASIDIENIILQVVANISQRLYPRP